MKKNGLCFFFLVLFSSCKDEPAEDVLRQLSGKWTLESAVFKNATNGISSDTTIAFNNQNFVIFDVCELDRMSNSSSPADHCYANFYSNGQNSIKPWFRISRTRTLTIQFNLDQAPTDSLQIIHKSLWIDQFIVDEITDQKLVLNTKDNGRKYLSKKIIFSKK